MSSNFLSKKVLLFSPHPDDHLIFAGTLMLLKDKGFELQEIVATGGEKGPWWVSEKKQKVHFKREELIKTRKKEIAQASKIIGITKTSFLGLPDGGVKMSLKIVEKIVRLIRKERPTIVFTTNPHDYHSDHRELAKIVKEGVERSSWSYQFKWGKPWRVPIMLYGEGFYFGKFHIVVDITPYLEKKKQIIEIYSSQISPGEKKLLESMNIYRGFFIRNPNVLSAEAFEIPEEFPIYFNQILEIFSST